MNLGLTYSRLLKVGADIYFVILIPIRKLFWSLIKPRGPINLAK